MNRDQLCESNSRQELEEKFTEYQKKFGAHEDPAKTDNFSTGDNHFFCRRAFGGKKDGKEIELDYSEMTRIQGGVME